MLTHEYTPVSESEYLALEARSPVRHEYVAGELFAMAGGTLRHSTIALNVASALRARLRSTPCRAFMSDVRVRVEKHNAYYYPDVLGSCGRGLEAPNLESATVTDPVLIVEVLSSATEPIDRREKLLAYRTLPSLVEYALVSQDQARVEIHRRRGDIGWELTEYSGNEAVEFTAVRASIPMQEIYEGALPEPGAAAP